MHARDVIEGTCGHIERQTDRLQSSSQGLEAFEPGFIVDSLVYASRVSRARKHKHTHTHTQTHKHKHRNCSHCVSITIEKDGGKEERRGTLRASERASERHRGRTREKTREWEERQPEGGAGRECKKERTHPGSKAQRSNGKVTGRA